MSLFALLALAALSPLEEAVRCYEELDYACAEERLAVALASPLAEAEQARARLYDALLGLAHRDPARARRAVRALLAADPRFTTELGPPALAALLEAERPPPPPPPGLFASAHFKTARLLGEDAKRWGDGLGAEATVGVVLDERWLLGLTGALTEHEPRLSTLEGLRLGSVAATGAWRQPLGPVWVTPGLSLGIAQVSVEGALEDQRYWGGWAELPVEVSWPLFLGVGPAVKASGLVFATDDSGRAAFSVLWTLSAGLSLAL